MHGQSWQYVMTPYELALARQIADPKRRDLAISQDKAEEEAKRFGWTWPRSTSDSAIFDSEWLIGDWALVRYIPATTELLARHIVGAGLRAWQWGHGSNRFLENHGEDFAVDPSRPVLLSRGELWLRMTAGPFSEPMRLLLPFVQRLPRAEEGAASVSGKVSPASEGDRLTRFFFPPQAVAVRSFAGAKWSCGHVREEAVPQCGVCAAFGRLVLK